MTRLRVWARKAREAGARSTWVWLPMLLAVLTGSVLAASELIAADRVRVTARFDQENTPYNASYVFVRLSYNMGGYFDNFGRRGGGDACNGRAPWAHDHPCAEQNLMRLLGHITTVKPGVIGGNVISVGDPELHRYPIAYMSEPGYWDMNEQETANMRSYVLKGGFLIFDDFPYRAMPQFESQMKRMLPELEPILLTAAHPVFQSFFEIESLDNLIASYDGGQPVFLGYFLENDTNKRMLAVVNFLNDLGERWEYAERGFLSDW